MSNISGPNSESNGLILALDAGNPESYSPNRFWAGTDIADWAVTGAGTGSRCYIGTDNDVASPVGGRTFRQDQTGADPYTNTYASARWNLIPTTAGDTWTISAYGKASTSGNAEIFVFGATATGAVDTGGNYYDLYAANCAMTTDWQRFSLTTTMANAATQYYQFRLDGLQDGVGGETVWWDGVQIEAGNTMSGFNAAKGSNAIGEWADISGNSNNGTLVNAPTWTDGYFDFDYTASQRVEIGSNSSLNFLGTAAYTLEAWVYPTRNPGASNWTGVFDREFNVGAGRDGYNLYFLGSAGTDTFFVSERWCSGVRTPVSVTVAQSLSVNAWQHIVAVYDGTNLRLYRNGSLAAGPTASSGSITNATTTVTIAERGGNYFDGRIAAANIYDQALTAAQVLQNFNAQRQRFGI